MLAQKPTPGTPKQRLMTKRTRAAGRLYFAAALILAAMPTAAQDLQLGFPVDCTLGESCFIQNYVDHDPGPEAHDFTCAAQTYDTHRGTDIALNDLAAMDAGVNIHPAAAGTVAATRDGMPDILFTDPDAPDITKRSCGNAVIIDHEDGWQTRYCHMKRGSVTVKNGDRVTPETVIGQIGLSGKTEFPHLHISVHKDKNVIDPFQPTASACGAADTTLWSAPIPYVAGGLVSAGFSDVIPEFKTIKAGAAHKATLPATAAALIVWAHIFGSQTGDVLQLTVIGEQGEFLSHTVLLKRTQARLFRATGRKRNSVPWPTGTYTGTITLTRDNTEIDRLTTQIIITN